MERCWGVQNKPEYVGKGPQPALEELIPALEEILGTLGILLNIKAPL